ncbi:MAG: gamma-glutamyltransferase, partial [Gemmatimonadota bacterium]|nr:gamma-glutamyltransferase [Gemmatimonadota bacterium]
MNRHQARHRARGLPVRRLSLLPVALGLALLAPACAGPPRSPAPASIDPVARVPEVRTTHASPVAFPDSWPYRPGAAPAVSAGGMVVSTDSLASAAGVEVLRDGGNAFDAAIAVHFALAVVHPEAGNLGGGGFLVARTADDERVALDFRERAPAGASKDMYVDAQGRVTGDGVVGHLASGVPGSVAGMRAAHERFGSLPWARLLEPAIRLAGEGFRVTPRHRFAIAAERDLLGRFPASAAAFLPGGAPPEAGSLRRQPDLARTLRAIAADGPDAFYRGWIADSLAA